MKNKNSKMYEGPLRPHLRMVAGEKFLRFFCLYFVHSLLFVVFVAVVLLFYCFQNKRCFCICVIVSAVRGFWCRTRIHTIQTHSHTIDLILYFCSIFSSTFIFFFFSLFSILVFCFCFVII